MTKKEKELQHDRLTYQMMENVNRHAAVQEIIKEEQEEESNKYIELTVAFCAGCLVTLAASKLLMMM